MREIGAVLRAALAGAFPVVVCEGSRVRGARQRRRPNVLLITTDEERQSFPHLDGFTLPAREWLQERGTTFDRHYDSSAMCSSSRSVMYTGRHVPVTQIYDNYDMPYIRPLDPELKTLGSLIQAAGYYTAYQGKWHLSNAYRSPDRPRSTAAAQQPYWFTDFNHWVISTAVRGLASSSTSRRRGPSVGSHPVGGACGILLLGGARRRDQLRTNAPANQSPIGVSLAGDRPRGRQGAERPPS